MNNIPIIYEDAHVVVFDKPSGLMMHGDGRAAEPTLADYVAEKYPEAALVGEPMQFGGKSMHRPGIVHRLDKDTSGAVVVAKDQATFLSLKKQFQDREVKKTYLAFVHGKVMDDAGRIDRPLGRSPKDFREWSAHASARGTLREAVTNYKVLGRFAAEGKEFTYLELTPETGRTHQLRAHLKFIHHPIVGDSLYAGKRGGGLGLSRLALHAAKLEFTLPSGKRVTAEAPLPPDLAKALQVS
ncbi:RluA family pseudouridine synthase [Candidatus Parcubacteria bacterium]|nr:RluA family pseudouridine synthase [Candidatus Parcubacteria bacterium]